MPRAIIRCEPKWLVKQLGFPGAAVKGARLYGGTVDIIVDSPEIEAEAGKLAELKPIKKRKGISYEEQEEPAQPCK